MKKLLFQLLVIKLNVGSYALLAWFQNPMLYPKDRGFKSWERKNGEKDDDKKSKKQ